jgi:7-keto-8-aminopelargonate synthetase-like enzyme
MQEVQTGLDIAFQSLDQGRQRGVLHLYNESESFDGRIVSVDGQKLINFGSCSYLGLEKDSRLVEGCVDAVRAYGTQFSASRAYMSSGQYKELEGLFRQLFNQPVLVVPTTSLGHLSAFQALVGRDDVVVLDHQAHAAIQAAAQYAKGNGTAVKMIRHNNLDHLEKLIVKYRQPGRKIWYCIDGVFSMYGDLAPLDAIYALADKYPSLQIYVDDAHGFSWYGKNGLGTVRGRMHHHERLYLAVSLNKGFACSGGLLIFPDEESRHRVRCVGNGVVFSGPLQPPMLGACIVSAKLHLSGEISELQATLKDKIEYCRSEIQRLGLLDVAHSESPIFYIGVGPLKVGYNLVSRMKSHGYYVNMGLYPAVPVNNTGIRFTLNNHLSKSDIHAMLACLAEQYPLALQEEEVSFSQVVQAFRLPLEQIGKYDYFNRLGEERQSTLTVKLSRSLSDEDRLNWNAVLGGNSIMGAEVLAGLQSSLDHDNSPENQWQFNYVQIFDGGTLLLATVATSGLVKSDMFSEKSISQYANKQREQDRYAYTSKVLMLGSSLTEGECWYLNREHPKWREAVELLIKKLQYLQQEVSADTIILRDFHANDEELFEVFYINSFVRQRGLDSYSFKNLQRYRSEKYFADLKWKKRRYWHENIMMNESGYVFDVVPSLDEKELQQAYKLYTNVQERSVEISTYALPYKLFTYCNQSEDWEFIKIYCRESSELASIVLCYRTDRIFIPLIVGMDYRYQDRGIYRIALDRMLVRPKDLGYEVVGLGIGAGLEKHRFGADATMSYMFVQANDHFNLEALHAEMVEA